MEITRRVMVLFPGSLGDLLCFLPALEVIAEEWSGRVFFVGRASLFDLIRRLSYVDRVISLDSRTLTPLFVAGSGSVEDLALFSVVSRVFSWFGHNYPEVRANLARVVSGPVQTFDFFVGQEQCHAATYYLRCVGVQEVRCPTFVLGTQEKEWARQYWSARGWRPSTKVLAIHPGSGGRRKRWVSEGFTTVARWWKGQRNCQVLVLLGPAEAHEAQQWQQIGEVETDLSLVLVAALLSRADVYLGNDSGVSHLAGAVGARGVVLFGPTLPQLWRPLGGALTVLRNVTYRHRAPDTVGIPLSEISAEEVISALLRQMGEVPPCT